MAGPYDAFKMVIFTAIAGKEIPEKYGTNSAFIRIRCWRSFDGAGVIAISFPINLSRGFSNDQ